MITYTILTLSLFINIFFIWYMRQFIIRFNFYSQNSQNLMAVMEEYQTHLEKVYGLETFYGDTTLRDLLEHTNDLSVFVRDIKENFDFEKEEEE